MGLLGEAKETEDAGEELWRLLLQSWLYVMYSHVRELSSQTNTHNMTFTALCEYSLLHSPYPTVCSIARQQH